MGHVDHGKTSLLDAIRETEVAAGEAGGITQHIGAYQVHHNGKTITFLDTPGHEAFTAMRARGARVTDIAVIVVAADDGASPQTNEAIDHANAADVPIVVAVNKIDKEGADPTRVRTEMTQLDLQPSEWGGETEFVDVSAKTGTGLDDLLDTILVVAELEELEANPNAEASRRRHRVQARPGPRPGRHRADPARHAARRRRRSWPAPSLGRVRAMIDYRGERVDEAVPGDPVEVLGFDGVPDAGEFVRVVENDKEARRLAAERETREKTEALARRSGRKVSFEDVFRRARRASSRSSPLVIKADVAGSVEAFEDEIAKLPQDEIRVNVHPLRRRRHQRVRRHARRRVRRGHPRLQRAPGGRRRARWPTARASRSATTRSSTGARRPARAMTGLLEPEEVEETRSAPSRCARPSARRKIGTIAGSYVTDGMVRRGAKVRLVRDGTVVYETTIDTLRRFNDDVREVAAGYECGIVLAQLPGRQGRRRPRGLRDAAGRARAPAVVAPVGAVSADEGLLTAPAARRHAEGLG